MFISYDLKQFGQALKKKRLSCQFTQKNINELTGINEDTLRRIENGLVIPKYETLEILSVHYKADLLALLQLSRSDKALLNIYELMDQIIVNNSIDDIQKVRELLITYKIKHKNNKRLVNVHELEQLEIFIQASEWFHSDEESKLQLAEKTIEEIFPNFVFDKPIPESELFSLLEIRLLLVLATTKMLLSKYNQTLNILNFILVYMQNDLLPATDYVKMCMKVHSNISYCYHMSSDNLKALESAKVGIDYIIKNQSTYCLAPLLARKAIAEHYLRLPEAIDSFRKCRYLLEITNQQNLLTTYQKIILEKYQVDLYAL